MSHGAIAAPAAGAVGGADIGPEHIRLSEQATPPVLVEHAPAPRPTSATDPTSVTPFQNLLVLTMNTLR
jgi:hypothetical protein